MQNCAPIIRLLADLRARRFRRASLEVLREGERLVHGPPIAASAAGVAGRWTWPLTRPPLEFTPATARPNLRSLPGAPPFTWLLRSSWTLPMSVMNFRSRSRQRNRLWPVDGHLRPHRAALYCTFPLPPHKRREPRRVERQSACVTCSPVKTARPLCPGLQSDLPKRPPAHCCGPSAPRPAAPAGPGRQQPVLRGSARMMPESRTPIVDAPGDQLPVDPVIQHDGPVAKIVKLPRLELSPDASRPRPAQLASCFCFKSTVTPPATFTGPLIITFWEFEILNACAADPEFMLSVANMPRYLTIGLRNLAGSRDWQSS